MFQASGFSIPFMINDSQNKVDFLPIVFKIKFT